jgi:hypothetical protein
VTAADLSFRTLTWFLDERRPDVRSVAGLDRNLMEDFAVWLSERPGLKGPLSVSSRRRRLGMLHMFFERSSTGTGPTPQPQSSVHRRPPLPTGLPAHSPRRQRRGQTDGPSPVRTRPPTPPGGGSPGPHRQARHELCDPAPDAVVDLGGRPWLRIAVGKLRNGRMIPLHLDVAPV